MMYSALFLAATAAVASAQVTYDPTSGKFICPADKPNGAFCAGDSLSSNIIIRCKDGVGQPGNCDNNLAGYFPFGVQSSPCWQTSATSGIAACSKNCIVQGGSGTLNGTLTLPNCTAVPQSSSSSSTAGTTTTTYVQPTYTPEPTITKTYINPDPSTYSPQPNTTKTYINPGPSYNGTITITSTGTITTTCVTNGVTTTSTSTFTTTYCPPPTHVPSILSTLTPTYIQPSGTGSKPSGSPIPSENGTVPTGTSHTSATATPVGPSASATTGPILSNGAMTNSAGAGLAAVGLFIAYVL